MSQEPLKQYPKNQVYSTETKAIFQKASKISEKRSTANISGTFIEQVSNPSYESLNGLKKSEVTEKSHVTSKSNISPEIITLSNRIQFLQKELISLTQMLIDEQSQKQSLQTVKNENETLRNTIIKLQQINSMQEAKIKKLQLNNQQLLGALQSVNEQLNKQKVEGSSRNMNQSKTSKSRQQVQQDIVRLNQQIEAILQKLSALNIDYEQLTRKNEELNRQNNLLIQKIQKISQEKADNSIQLGKDDEILYYKQEILLLKQEIEQMNQISIRKQSELQENFHSRLQKYQQQIERLKKSSKGENSNLNVKDEQAQTMLEVKDVQIRSLQVDGQILKKQLQIKGEENSILQSELKQLRVMSNSAWSWKQKVINLEQANKRKSIEIEESQIIIRKYAQRIKEVQNECFNLTRQIKQKNFKIEELDFESKQRNRYETYCKGLQEEINNLKQQKEEKEKQQSMFANKQAGLCKQIQILRQQLLTAHAEVDTANLIRQQIQEQFQKLKNGMKQLKTAGEKQQQHIKEIQSEQESSRLQIEQNIQAQLKGLKEKINYLQTVNKNLQKLALNQKVQKQNQNKKYKDVIEHYKQLNQQLSMQLELNREANMPSHENCPLVNHSTWKPLQNRAEEKNIVDLRLQLQREKGKNQTLILQWQRSIEYQKGAEIKIHQLAKKQKQLNFLRLDNSSLRSQISQLNSKISQLKNISQVMRKSEQNLKNERQSLKYALQREFEAKLEVQKYQIINQYNILLKERNIKLDYNQHPIEESRNQNQTQYFRGNNSSVRAHTEYKKLQEQFMKLHRKNLESEQLYNKQITQCRDQIQKLAIQNEYHKKTIDDILAEGYGLKLEDISRASFGTKVNRGSSDRNSDEKYNTNMNIKSYNQNLSQQKLKKLLKPVNEIFPSNYAQVQKSQINHLKTTIDAKLIQLQITPREPSSTVERADWLIQKLSSMIDQLRQDCETIRRQKKDQAKETNRLKVKVESLEYQKSNILQELSIAIQKYQFLEKKYEKLSVGNTNTRTKRQQYEEQIPSLNLSEKATYGQIRTNQHQNDVHLHEANIIRQHRLDLLRRYQKEIENMEQEQMINFSK